MRKLIFTLLLLLAFVTIQGFFAQARDKGLEDVTIERDPISLLKTEPRDNPSAQDRPSTGLQVIPYQEAWKHIGEYKTVQGKLEHVFNSGKATILGFTDPHRGQTKIRILNSDYAAFSGNPERLYRAGQEIQATGKIEWYQGDPTINVSSPSSIYVINEP